MLVLLAPWSFQCKNKDYNLNLIFSDPEGSYWILETDYHNYSVVYSCTVVDILTPIKYFLLKENNLQSKAIGLMGYLQHFMVIVQDFLFGAIKLEFAWILAREKHLDPEMVRNMPI